jgi:uncharacterized membrane protein YfcA
MDEVALLLVLGFGAGVMAGLFGVGGGVLFVPALVLVGDLSQIEAEATSLLAILPTVVAGTWRQWQYGNIWWGTALLLGLGAVAGVEAGVRVAQWLPEDDLRRLFALLVFAVAAQIAWRYRRPPTYSPQDASPPR